MRVAFVVQRFGKDIVGGAEKHALQLARKLHRDCNWTIDVYTTTARDYQSWKPYYRAGLDVSEGFCVRRYHSRIKRRPLLFGIYNRLVSPLLVQKKERGPAYLLRQILRPLLKPLESLWYILQGPWCPELVTELISYQHRYKKVYFFTYLYYPTVRGLPELAHKSVLIPTAHDEPPFYFPSVRNLFARASEIFVNSPAEKKLVLTRFTTEKPPVRIAGIGISDFVCSEKAGPSVFPQKLPEHYLCFLGRLGPGKGVHQLTEYFIRLCEDRPDLDLHLVLAGPQEKNFKKIRHKKIHYPGIVDDAEKITLLSLAFAVCNPSPRESLSLLVLEALALKKPVLVNGHNPVLKHYSNENGSVFDFHGYDDFRRLVHFLGSAGWKFRRDKELQQSREWVLNRYSWERILRIFQEPATPSGGITPEGTLWNP